MANEKIHFTIDGKNNTKKLFTEINGDVKKFQNSSRDAFGTLKNVASEAAGTIDGKLGGALQNISGVLSKMGKGGLIGAVAIATTTALGAIIKAYNEHKKAVEDHLELMRRMSEGQQNLIDIQLAAKEAAEQGQLDIIAEKANEAVKQVERLSSAMKALTSSEDAAMGANFNLHIAKINEEFSKALNEACEELKPVVEAEKNLAIALKRQEDARTQSQMAIDREKTALVDVEEKIALQKAAIEAETKAGYDTTAAYERLNELQMERSTVVNRLNAAETNAEVSAIEHQNAVNDATATLNRANQTWEELCESNERIIAAQDSIAEIDEKLKTLKDQEYNTKNAANKSLTVINTEIKQVNANLNSAQSMSDKIDKGVEAHNKLHNLSPKKFKYDSDGKLSNPSDVGQAYEAYNKRVQKETRRREKLLKPMKEKADAALKIPENKRTKMQQADIDKYNAMDEYYNGEKRAKDKLEQLQKDREQLQTQLQDDVSTIRQQVDNLESIKTSLEQQGLK